MQHRPRRKDGIQLPAALCSSYTGVHGTCRYARAACLSLSFLLSSVGARVTLLLRKGYWEW